MPTTHTSSRAPLAVPSGSPSSDPTTEHAPAWPGGFLHPHVQLGLGVALVTVSEILLKHGAEHASQMGHESWTGIAALRSLWVWGGIACYVASFVSWLHVLRFVPLVLAFNVMNLVHVTIPAGAAFVLGESLPPLRLAGIALIVAGVALLAPALASMESRLERAA